MCSGAWLPNQDTKEISIRSSCGFGPSSVSGFRGQAPGAPMILGPAWVDTGPKRWSICERNRREGFIDYCGAHNFELFRVLTHFVDNEFVSKIFCIFQVLELDKVLCPQNGFHFDAVCEKSHGELWVRMQEQGTKKSIIAVLNSRTGTFTKQLQSQCPEHSAGCLLVAHPEKHECVLEACNVCQKLRMYNFSDDSITTVYSPYHFNVLCPGPENTLLAVESCSCSISQLKWRKEEFVLSKDFNTNTAEHPIGHTEAMCYNQQNNTLVLGGDTTFRVFKLPDSSESRDLAEIICSGPLRSFHCSDRARNYPLNCLDSSPSDKITSNFPSDQGTRFLLSIYEWSKLDPTAVDTIQLIDDAGVLVEIAFPAPFLSSKYWSKPEQFFIRSVSGDQEGQCFLSIHDWSGKLEPGVYKFDPSSGQIQYLHEDTGLLYRIRDTSQLFAQHPDFIKTYRICKVRFLGPKQNQNSFPVCATLNKKTSHGKFTSNQFDTCYFPHRRLL